MWESEDLEAGARRKVVVLIAVVAAAALGFGLWYWYVAHHRPVAPPPPVSATPPPPASTEPEIANPLPEANEPAAAALPAHNDSDTLARDSIAGVLGRGAVERPLVPQNIVRHIVSTVDNLPRKNGAVVQAPIPLVQPRVMYEYSDADLEGRSVG